MWNEFLSKSLKLWGEQWRLEIYKEHKKQKFLLIGNNELPKVLKDESKEFSGLIAGHQPHSPCNGWLWRSAPEE